MSFALPAEFRIELIKSLDRLGLGFATEELTTVFHSFQGHEWISVQGSVQVAGDIPRRKVVDFRVIKKHRGFVIADPPDDPQCGDLPNEYLHTFSTEIEGAAERLIEEIGALFVQRPVVALAVSPKSRDSHDPLAPFCTPGWDFKDGEPDPVVQYHDPLK